MKKHILIFTLLITNMISVNAQNINQSDIDTACFVISELMAEAKKNGNDTSLLIYSNTIDQIKKNHTVHGHYLNYFDSIKANNPLLNQGIVIFLNDPPQAPGFTNKQVEHFMFLKKDHVFLDDFNDFMILKKLNSGKIKLEHMNELELKNIKKLKTEVESLKIEN